MNGVAPLTRKEVAEYVHVPVLAVYHIFRVKLRPACLVPHHIILD